MIFRIQVFEGPGFSGFRFSRFFWVQVFLGPGFSRSRSRVRVQVLEVAIIKIKNLEHSPKFKLETKRTLTSLNAKTKTSSNIANFVLKDHIGINFLYFAYSIIA